MSAVVEPLPIEQGATFILFFQWCYQGVDPLTPGDPRDLTGWTLRSQIRKSQQEVPYVSVTTTAPTTNGSKIYLGWDPADDLTNPFAASPGTPDPANGWVAVFLTDDDTDLIAAKTAKYDLEAEDPVTAFVYRLLKGTVTTDPNITQESDDPVVT